MFVTCLMASLIRVVPVLAIDPTTTQGCWRLERDTIHSGGSVTLIINESCGPWHSLTLQIDDRQPIPLDRVGPSNDDSGGPIPGQPRHIMVFFDLLNPEGVEAISGDEGGFHLRPIFVDSGDYMMTLRRRDTSLGAYKLTVLECPKDADAAVRLLSPLVGKRQANQDGSLWMRLIFGITNALTERELKLLRDQLPIMKQHPDWGEICEMQLALLEAKLYCRMVNEALEAEKQRGETVADVPSPSDFVTRALEGQLESAFARALQDQIREHMAGYNRLIRLHRGEPVEEVFRVFGP